MRYILSALAIASAVVGFSPAPASAADMDRSCVQLAKDSRFAPTAYARKAANDEFAARQCPVHKAQPPIAYKAPYNPPADIIASACGVGGFGGGLFGGRGRVSVYGGGAVTSKHMNDGHTGVNKSDLTFGSAVIGAGFCYGLTDVWSLDISGDYMFKGNKVSRSYASGWQETDQFSLFTLRAGPTYHNGRLSAGVHALVSWGALDWEQNLVWGGKTYNLAGTSNGTFAGLGGSIGFGVTNNLEVKFTYDHGWLVSSVPAGASKTDYDRGMVTVGWKF